MHYNAEKFLLLAASILPAALAQTSSNCNPLKGCKQDDKALGTTFTYDYSKNHAAAPQWDIVSSSSRISYENDGMHMRVQAKGDAPTIQSQFYIFWGKIEVVMKAAPGQGVVSSLVYQSDDLDEIDVEFVGSQTGNVQTNIFSKGDEDVHIYGGNSPVNDAVGTFHTYTVDWTPTEITWYIDGVSARVLSRASLGDVYPQTPMQIKFGPWAAGDPSNPIGTRQWAGGDIDYSKAPFDMVVQSMTITDYSTGATTYRYKDSTGSSDSIEIVKGNAPVSSTISSVSSSQPSSSSSSVPPKSTSTSAPSSSASSSGASTTKSASTESSAVPTTKSTFVVVSESTAVVTQTSSGSSSHATGTTTFQTSAIKTTSAPAGATSALAPSSASSVRLSWYLLAAAGAFMLFL